MNKPISYPLAKLLKEKGFDIPLNKVYHVINDYTVFNKTDSNLVVTLLNGDKWECANEPYNWNGKKSVTTAEYYSAPTIADVIMWLYEKHDIWIICFPTDGGWTFDIFNKMECVKSESFINSPTEAYEAAIKYTLTKLI